VLLLPDSEPSLAVSALDAEVFELLSAPYVSVLVPVLVLVLVLVLISTVPEFSPLSPVLDGQ